MVFNLPEKGNSGGKKMMEQFSKEIKEFAQGVLGVVALILVVGGLVTLAHFALDVPIVQKEYPTGAVVAVITSDGVSHPPSYLEEKNIHRYDVEWVRPLAIR